MTTEQIAGFERSQASNHFHPFTCPDDGDAAHIAYEFAKKHAGEDYVEYLAKERAKGVNYPYMAFTETKLIATPDGLKCPACDYRQSFGGHEAHLTGLANQVLDAVAVDGAAQVVSLG